MLTKLCNIPHASRQFAQGRTTKQVKRIILQQRWQVRFQKQADKINQGACVGRRSRNKSIIGKFRNNAWSYRVQVLCTNKLPLYFRKFSQHEMFDCNSKGAEIQSMPSLAQINFFKVCMKNELRYVKQHLWRYEYDYKYNRYSLVTTTVAVKQLHVTS